MKILVIQSHPGVPDPVVDIPPEAGLDCQTVYTLRTGTQAVVDHRYDAVVADTAALADAGQSDFRAVFRRMQSPTCPLILAAAPGEDIPVQVLSAGIDGCIALPLRLSRIQELFNKRMVRDVDLLEKRSELREKDEEIAILVAISNIVTSNLEFIPLLEAIAHQTSEAIQTDRTTIFMYDAEGGKLQAAFAEGLGAYSITIPATHGIAGYVATERKMVNVSNAYQDPRFYNEIDRGTGYVTRTILCAPMISPNGDLIGVVQCLNKRAGPFNDSDERMLNMLTPLFAIAIENALLYTDLQEEVRHTEEMTAEKIRSERLAVVGKMARSVTRDIAGPMADIVDQATRLSHENITVPERDETCQAIETIVDHLVDLAQELLDFSRENMETNIQKTGLAEFAAVCAPALKGYRIVTHPPDSGGSQASIDPERFTQALVCVATVLERYEQADIHLKVDATETEVYFSFYPLSARSVEAVNRMLGDPFTNTDEEHAIGMKLAVAKRIVDLHKGRFAAEADRLSVIIPK